MPLKKKRSRSLQQIDEPFEPDEEYDIVDIDQVPGEITLNLLNFQFQTILKFCKGFIMIYSTKSIFNLINICCLIRILHRAI